MAGITFPQGLLDAISVSENLSDFVRRACYDKLEWQPYIEVIPYTLGREGVIKVYEVLDEEKNPLKGLRLVRPNVALSSEKYYKVTLFWSSSPTSIFRAEEKIWYFIRAKKKKSNFTWPINLKNTNIWLLKQQRQYQ